MQLNTLKPAPGARHLSKRLGRGIGSGKGKTSGKGHKGQRARAGGFHKVGFEGGQMPLQRRLPKFGFTSLKALKTTELQIRKLACFEENARVNLTTLKEVGLVNSNIKHVKLIGKTELSKPLHIQGLRATATARKIIEAAGGKVEE
ncbi:MAG: 50S ribosomal protein L15 [uncultured bacterium]|nr:MAG: 50S ribosomal protein L15 [uncultured bacterium]OGT16839.1 MAG: 50S ribosomal protein L15 [Gammaproteobacteria bacterium RIFCSPHIGHO2_02_FULL_38_33]OGT23915.1 MAG: 50S ribosomal protein L15 [Gammaproteobacteria bacterium RIFCSPHIGHO2_12_38_15]OGT67117.1 MAG: 50S ribosomal protein L15 [Gammaproteobacteria bacterium RIFCSPLOWO2_02_FULL_38_11]OGT76112.1 MAG: 50S ribosomal protein L15 [Gammaproteobacteria bacterium RIFCSPLOWO2_12_FULL_38_14]